MSLIRLDKFISSQLNISRNDAKKIIKDGRVKRNSETLKKADTSVDTESDVIFVNDKEIIYKKHIYIMQNKPKGVVSASASPSDVTVIDILPDELKRNGLFPAGRLDKDTTGFVLITDDGEFAHNILSPSHHVPKTYIVEVSRHLSEDEISRFTRGMMIGEELFKPAKLRLVDSTEKNETVFYEIIIVEGRYHQIKRMFSAVSNPLISLKRIAIGGLILDDKLQPGESKELGAADIESIKLY